MGKEYIKCVLLSPCLFNLYAEYMMQNARLEDSQAGIKIARRNINNLNNVVEKSMSPHSSILAWEIPWTEESGRLQSKVSLGVGHD